MKEKLLCWATANGTNGVRTTANVVETRGTLAGDVAELEVEQKKQQ
jgi:hypothetical protein